VKAREFLDQIEVSDKWRKDRIVCPYEVKQIVWHRKGDYIASITRTEGAEQVIMHQISKSKSQIPFSRHSGTVNHIAFHPTRPYFFVAVSLNYMFIDHAIDNFLDSTAHQVV
jgi:hypothetical protein